MYFNELKKSLNLSDEYSIENLKKAYVEEKVEVKRNHNLKSSKEYSLLEILESLEKFGLYHNESINSDYLTEISQEQCKTLEEEPKSIFSTKEIDMLIEDIDTELEKLDELEEIEKIIQEAVKEGGNSVLKKIGCLMPQDSFSQAYKIRCLKTYLWCFADNCSRIVEYNNSDIVEWLNFDFKNKINNMSRLVHSIAQMIFVSKEPSSKDNNILKRKESGIKNHIKMNLKEDIKKSSFTSDDLLQISFYGQIISFILLVENRKEESLFSYKEEAISYIAYFLTDVIIQEKNTEHDDIILFAKKGLKIVNLLEQQIAFNLLGVSAIESGQKQLAYDTFFSWVNCRIVGEIQDLVPIELFKSDIHEKWRANEGKKSVALMKGNFAYVCGIICETYEPNSKRWKIFHNIALTEISDAIGIDPDDPSWHCTYGTLLSQRVADKENSLLEALEQYKIYKNCKLKPSDALESGRFYCDALLDILSESFANRNDKNFFEWIKDEKIQELFNELSVELKKYCNFSQFGDIENRDSELLRAQKKRKKWEPYFNLQKMSEEYSGIPDIKNLEYLLVLIRNMVALLRQQLKRWEYNLNDYYARYEQDDWGVAGKRNGIKPIAYYTTLNTIKFVFDDLYQETPNQILRKARDGEKGKNCLTVMHAKYMNDPYEGLALLEGFLNNIKESEAENILFPHDSSAFFRESIYNSEFVFLKSFTECVDKLFMWNRYASDYSIDGKNSNGCCVQLDAESFGQLVNASNNTEASIKLENTPEDDYYLYRVVYIEKDGIIDKNKNIGISSQVEKYYDALNDLINTLNLYFSVSKTRMGDMADKLIEYVREFLQQALHIIIFLFKDSDYSDEMESRLIFVRTPNQQNEIRLLQTSPEKLCINPFFQVYISQIMFGPNVRDQEMWTPYFQYQLNRMWKKHPALFDKPEILAHKYYRIENSKIHYHT